MVCPHVVLSMFCFALVSSEDLDPGCGLDDHSCDSFSGTAALQMKSSNWNKRLTVQGESTLPDMLFKTISVQCTQRRDGKIHKEKCNIGELKLYGGGGKITNKGITITPTNTSACSNVWNSARAFDGTGIPLCMEGSFMSFKSSFSPPTPLDGFKIKTADIWGHKNRDMVQWKIHGYTTNSYTYNNYNNYNNKYVLSDQTSDYPIPDKLNTWGDKIPLCFVKDVSSGKCMREMKCKLDFSQASVEYDEAAMFLKIVYKNICSNTDVINADLVIKSMSPYGPDTVEKATTKSGYINGYGQIHMDANHSTKFSFDFVHTSSGDPVFVHSSVLSFLDIDKSDDGSVSEEILIKGVGNHYVVGSDVLSEDVDGTLKATGTQAAEPTNYTSSASIALLDVSHFELTFSNVGMAVGGRNLMMTGATPLFTEC